MRDTSAGLPPHPPSSQKRIISVAAAGHVLQSTPSRACHPGCLTLPHPAVRYLTQPYICRTRRYVGQTTKTGADVALINSGGIRASMDAGDIATADVYAVFPYGNLVSLISVTGAQLVAALENSASVDFSNPSGKFSQVRHGTAQRGTVRCCKAVRTQVHVHASSSAEGG